MGVDAIECIEGSSECHIVIRLRVTGQTAAPALPELARVKHVSFQHKAC